MRTRSTGKPLVIVIDPGPEVARGYLIDQVAEDADIWLFDRRPPTWAAPYVVGFSVVDALDLAEVRAAAVRVKAAQPVHGVLGWDELKMHAVVEAALALGLPTVDHDVIERCRDKHQTRVRLAAAGVPQPRSELAADERSGRRLAEQLGYPVVLKPRALGASMGVRRVDGPADFAAAYAFARTAEVSDLAVRSVGVLVEECIEGPEISVDCVHVDGVTTPVFVARKDSSRPPYFEEVQHVVAAADPLLSDPTLLEVLRAAHAALGFTVGITHTELRLTSSGPKIIEVNCRIGGDLIPYAGYLASGVAIGRLYAAIACGRPVTVARTRTEVGGVRFLYPPRAGRVAEVLLDLSALPAGTVEARIMVDAGEEIAPPPSGGIGSRWGQVVVAGDDPDQCRDRLRDAEHAFSLVLEPG